MESENKDFKFKPLVFTEVGDLLDGPVSRRPERRSGHRTVCDDGNLYSFGGYLRLRNTVHLYMEQLWCFNFAEGRWKLLPTTGEAPKLDSHCAALYGNYLHVFGGTGVFFGESSNMLTRCDLRSLKWEKVEATGDIPQPKYGQALILDEGRRQLYVVGGTTTGFDFTMDVHRLDLTTKSWKLVYAYKGNPTDPLPRYRHEIGYDGSNIYVFGGGTNVTAYELDTIPVFNIGTKKWSKLETKSASAAPIPQVIGEPGDSDNDDQQPREEGFPKRRKCHASVQVGDDMYICGGCNDTEVYDDVWKFHIPTREWQLLPERLPIPLAFHTACVTSEGCMYIFGGVTDIERSVPTNRIFKMWLKTPKLKELCWEALVNRSKAMKTSSYDALVEMGIPSEFAKRAHPSPPGGNPNKEVESAWESDYLKSQNWFCNVQ